MSRRFELLAPIFRCRVGWTPWSECVINWAMTLLAKGTDTTNPRILAGLSASDGVDEITHYFDATLADLDQQPVTEMERSLGEVRGIAEAIVGGAIAPEQGTGLIHERAVSPLGHPPLLQPWRDLDGGFVMRDNKAEELAGGALAHESGPKTPMTRYDEPPNDMWVPTSSRSPP